MRSCLQERNKSVVFAEKMGQRIFRAGGQTCWDVRATDSFP